MSKTKTEDCNTHNSDYKVVRCSKCNEILKIVNLDEIYEIYILREKVRKMDEELNELYKLQGLIRK